MEKISGIKKPNNLESSYGLGNPSANGVVNSIYTVEKKYEDSPVGNTSNLDEHIEKICSEFSKLGLDPQELKSSGVLYRITGMNQEQLENSSKEELKKVFDCLREAIKDCIKDGKIDIEAVGELANNYYIAVSTNWSIQGFKKYNSNVTKSSLFDRLNSSEFPKIKELLKDYENIKDVPKDVLARAVDIFFNEVLIGKEKSPEKIKAQLQTFGRLLINTPDEEKIYFKEVLPVLIAENRLPGLEAVQKSFATEKARQDWANSWTADDYNNLLTNKDVYNEVMSTKDGARAIATIVSDQSEEVISKNHNEIQIEAKEFFEKNKEALVELARKEEAGEELTQEEKELKLIRDNYFVAVKSGEIAGTAINNVITEEAKDSILAQMNKDAFELPIYKKVLEELKIFVEDDNNNYSISNEKLAEIINEATNGNYNIIKTGSDEPLKPPYNPVISDVIRQSADNLFETRPAVDPGKLNWLKKEFIVENFDDTPQKSNLEKEQKSGKIYTLCNEALLKGRLKIKEYLKASGVSSFQFARDVLTSYNNVGQNTKRWALDYIKSKSFTVQEVLFNSIKYSRSAMLEVAKHFDISKYDLDLSVSTEKAVKRIEEQKV